MKVVEDHFLLGAACAVIAGSIVVFIDGFGGLAGEMLGEPGFVALGLLVASLAGGTLARKVVDVSRNDALGIAILLGLIVPMAVGAIVFPPLAPIGALVGLEMWPATVPAGFIWMVAVRSLARSRVRPDQLVHVGVALGLALTLLAIRFTQPAWTSASDGTRCVSFPTEDIVSLAWSPDGAWLGIGSRRHYDEGIVRVLERESGRIVEVARGFGVGTDVAGVAVGPDGTTAFLDESYGEPPGAVLGRAHDEAWIMLASPGSPPLRHARLPGPAIADLTYTTDGIAGVLYFDPAAGDVEIHRLVWMQEGATSKHLQPIAPGQATRHPILAPLVRPEDEPMTIATPTGTRDVGRPGTYRSLSITRDGREIVFVDSVLYPDPPREVVIALSTETGRRQTLASAEALDDPIVAGGWLAYRTVFSPRSSACIKPVDLGP